MGGGEGAETRGGATETEREKTERTERDWNSEFTRHFFFIVRPTLSRPLFSLLSLLFPPLLLATLLLLPHSSLLLREIPATRNLDAVLEIMFMVHAPAAAGAASFSFSPSPLLSSPFSPPLLFSFSSPSTPIS